MLKEKEELFNVLKLKEMGFVEMSLSDFEESISAENRVIALSGQGSEKKIFVVGSEKLSKLGFTYKDCLDDLLDFKIYNQRVSREKIEIDSEDNMFILEKYESSLTKENMVKNRDTSKVNRSVKGLRK